MRWESFILLFHAFLLGALDQKIFEPGSIGFKLVSLAALTTASAIAIFGKPLVKRKEGEDHGDGTGQTGGEADGKGPRTQAGGKTG